MVSFILMFQVNNKLYWHEKTDWVIVCVRWDLRRAACAGPGLDPERSNDEWGQSDRGPVRVISGYDNKWRTGGGSGAGPGHSNGEWRVTKTRYQLVFHRVSVSYQHFETALYLVIHFQWVQVKVKHDTLTQRATRGFLEANHQWGRQERLPRKC